jgi:hypothetical protein
VRPKTTWTLHSGAAPVWDVITDPSFDAFLPTTISVQANPVVEKKEKTVQYTNTIIMVKREKPDKRGKRSVLNDIGHFSSFIDFKRESVKIIITIFPAKVQ